MKTKEEFEEYFPGFLSFVDTTGQQIPRPEDKDRRKSYYSGKKKKKQAIKNQIMVNNRGYILYKAKHKKGKRHDYDVYIRRTILLLQNKLLMYLIWDTLE